MLHVDHQISIEKQIQILKITYGLAIYFKNIYSKLNVNLLKFQTLIYRCSKWLFLYGLFHLKMCILFVKRRKNVLFFSFLKYSLSLESFLACAIMKITFFFSWQNRERKKQTRSKLCETVIQALTTNRLVYEAKFSCRFVCTVLWIAFSQFNEISLTLWFLLSSKPSTVYFNYAIDYLVSLYVQCIFLELNAIKIE